jgi:hypothetical protein
MAILPWAFEKDDCGEVQEVQEVQYEVPAWWSAGGPERRMRGRRMATDGCRYSGEVILHRQSHHHRHHHRHHHHHDRRLPPGTSPAPRECVELEVP